MKNTNKTWKRKIASIFAASAVCFGAAGCAALHHYDEDAFPPDNDDNNTSQPLPDQIPSQVPPPPQASPAVPPPLPPPPDPFRLDAGDDNYWHALGVSESGNDYTSKNRWGCAGRWQFCPTSIDGPGWGKYDGNVQGWLNDPAYQNFIIEEYTRNHWNEIVRLGLTRFIGQMIPSPHGPIRVTATGLLGGSHLVGIGRLQQLLERGINRPDAGGTRPTDYIQRFANTFIPQDWLRMPNGQSVPGTKVPAPSV